MNAQCPLPAELTAGRITLAHGEGGRLMRQLIEKLIVPTLASAGSVPSEPPRDLSDSVLLPAFRHRPVFTTDSYVVSPLQFPGGDIGSLAIHGTVNDLAMSGAQPRWLSLGLILEEGFPIATLVELLQSAARAARANDVEVVTGDTKVVPRGSVDGLFINTAGIGERVYEMPGPVGIEVGDLLVVSGPIARHGVAVLAAREQLRFEPGPISDCGSLWPIVETLWQARLPVKALRDATRGGVNAVLHEWSRSCQLSMSLSAAAVPVNEQTRGVCELLGLEPLNVACEGTLVAAVAADAVDAVLEAMQSCDIGRESRIIGEVVTAGSSPVVVRRALGQAIPLDEPSGAQLPRIC